MRVPGRGENAVHERAMPFEGAPHDSLEGIDQSDLTEFPRDGKQRLQCCFFLRPGETVDRSRLLEERSGRREAVTAAWWARANLGGMKRHFFDDP